MAALTITSLMSAARGEQLANQAGHGNLSATARALRTLFAQDRSQTQVKIGSCTGNGSSLNVTIQSGWTPAMAILFRAGGSALYLGHAAIGDGKAVYVRNAAVNGPASMGLITSLGIYLQSNGFSLGSTLSVSSKSYGYIAFKSAPGQDA